MFSPLMRDATLNLLGQSIQVFCLYLLKCWQPGEMLCPGCDFFERLSITCVGDTVIYSVVEHMGFSGKLYSIKNYFTYIEYYSSVSSYKSHSSNSYFGKNVQSQEFETKYRLCAQESSTYTRHGCMNIKINSTQKNLLENMFIFL